MDASYSRKKNALCFPAVPYVYALKVMQEKSTAQKF